MSSPAYGNRPSDPTTSDALTDLALDLRWSFNHAADQIWERLDPELWDSTHNPWVVLQTASREKLQSVTADPDFQKLLLDLQREKKTAEESDRLVSKGPSSFRSFHRCLFLHGVYVERGSTHLFRRPRQRCRRPTEDREQSRRPGHWGRSALPTRVFPAGNRCAGPSAGSISIQRPWSTADHSIAPAQWRVAAPGSRFPWHQALDPHLADSGGQNETVSPGYQRSREYSRASRHHQRTLRWWSRVTFETGNGTWHWRMAAPSRPRIAARSVPSQRRPCCIRGAGASSLLHGG